MNELFDVNREHQLLNGPIGIEYHLKLPFEEAVGKNSLSQSASFLLDTAARCVVVGLGFEARQLLSKTAEWLEYAIYADEKPRVYFKYATEARRHHNLALCNWLLTNEHDQRNLDEAVRYEEFYENSTKPDKAAASIVLPVYIDARHYTAALALFEKYWGQKRPTNVKRMTGEGGMSYIIAASKLRDEYTAEQVHAAGESFLRSNMAKFLRGHYVTAARWLKILHWNDLPNPPSAFETVRNATTISLGSNAPCSPERILQ